jgi:surface polysaccharide O-acyltransferase-like enzyme
MTDRDKIHWRNSKKTFERFRLIGLIGEISSFISIGWLMATLAVNLVEASIKNIPVAFSINDLANGMFFACIVMYILLCPILEVKYKGKKFKDIVNCFFMIIGAYALVNLHLTPFELIKIPYTVLVIWTIVASETYRSINNSITTFVKIDNKLGVEIYTEMINKTTQKIIEYSNDPDKTQEELDILEKYKNDLIDRRDKVKNKLQS